MIKQEIINQKDGHICIFVDEPFRIEIIKQENGYVLFGYKGTKVNIEQEPDLCYDTDI